MKLTMPSKALRQISGTGILINYHTILTGDASEFRVARPRGAEARKARWRLGSQPPVGKPNMTLCRLTC